MVRMKREISFSDLDKELKRISEKIEAIKLPQGFLEFLLYVVSEIFENIRTHSLAKNIVVDINIGPKKCKMAIADNGIGFRESYIRKKIYPKDDFSAIEFALSGLSSKDLQERGFGLYSIRKLVEALGGTLIIETGSARAIIKKNKINLQKIPKKRAGVFLNIDSAVRRIDFYKIIK